MMKAVIFDMDGLMIDSERASYECYKKYMNNLGMDMTVEFYKTLLGQTVAICKEKFLREYGENFPYEECVKTMHKMLNQQFVTEGVPIKKGLIELLKYLKENNFKTMVATSSARNRVDIILNQAGVMKYFDDTICGDEVKNGKPNPEVFLKACDKLKINPNEALVLEDSEAGIQAAFGGGIDVVCVPDMKYPDEKYQKMSKAICKDLFDVKTYIEECCQ